MKEIFWTRNLFYCILSLVVQQLIMASSTIWIVELSEALVEQKPFELYLFLFIASLIVSYIPGAASVVYWEKAKFDSMYQYITRFHESYKGVATALAEPGFRKNQEPWLTNENYLVVDEMTAFIYNGVSTVLNIVFNMLTLGFVIDIRLAMGYIVSFILLAGFFFFFRKQLEMSAAAFQENRRSMTQILLSAWDNIFVGNHYNMSRWKEKFHNNWMAAKDASAQSGLLTQLSSALAMVAALCPVIGVMVWLFYQNIRDHAMLAALGVTLPQHFQILQNVYLLSTYAMQWIGLKTKIGGLVGSLSVKPPEHQEMCGRIVWEKLTIETQNKQYKVDSLETFLEVIMQHHAHRITIHGVNGAGKSTLMNLIKQNLVDQVFYLPMQANLTFDLNEENQFLSPEDRIVRQIRELHGSITEDIILLDDWDSNLDSFGIQCVSEEIDRLAERYRVVEVRQRAY